MREHLMSELRGSVAGAAVGEPRGPGAARFEGFGNAIGSASGDEETFPRVGSADAASALGARYKSLSPARLLISSRAPCLTIPPGISPTTLLESPVLLTNVKAEPSPTTGTFFMPLVANTVVGSKRLSSPRSISDSIIHDERKSVSFEFEHCSTSGTSLSGNTGVSVEQKSETLLQASCVDQSRTCNTSYAVNSESVVATSNELTLSVAKAPIPEHGRASITISEHVTNVPQPLKAIDNGVEASINQKEHEHMTMAEKASEDGYNWRKYGQKHVKGSEFPRSYYKCTHANCPMKKMLERTHDGQITEIIYRGQHDHPKPQPNRRFAVGPVLCSQAGEKSEGFSSLTAGEAKPSNAQGQASYSTDPNVITEFSPVSASDGDLEVACAQPNDAVDDPADDDPESKRRRKDGISVDISMMGKTTQPRVVVQTLSEVDILDDGYRWRKYGQKVVKGNPNPRSYYKCTNAGCPVRKHVERASHDPKAVITTYEGKHNHDVPASRTSGHDTAAAASANECTILNSQPSVSTNGSLSTYGTMRVISHQYEQMEESDTISLDLGVGLSPRCEGRPGERLQMPEFNQRQNQDQQIARPGCSSTAIQPALSLPYYGDPGLGTEGFRRVEDTAESFTFKTLPLNHPSYEASVRRLLMGP